MPKWVCSNCSFINNNRNRICGGEGPRVLHGCRAPRFGPPSPAQYREWYCSLCSFRNSPRNHICGGYGGTLGCKAPMAEARELKAKNGSVASEEASDVVIQPAVHFQVLQLERGISNLDLQDAVARGERDFNLSPRRKRGMRVWRNETLTYIENNTKDPLYPDGPEDSFVDPQPKTIQETDFDMKRSDARKSDELSTENVGPDLKIIDEQADPEIKIDDDFISDGEARVCD